MSSHTPINEVQQELEGLSPELARLRGKNVASVNMDMLQELGSSALAAVPVEVPATAMRVVHRRQRWKKMLATAAAIMVGALLTYSFLNTGEDTDSEYALSHEGLSAELVKSFEAQTADPIAFLLDDELFYADEELLFSPAEDVLLDWADDGNVDEELSEEVMIDALW